ncbi:MAG: hypothetical protein WKF41_17085 [Gaiellaceae bacterium]
MKKLVLALALGFAAVAAPVAAGGGWATAGLSSLPPSGLKAGQDWPVDITVLQHGETPLTGVQPSITVRNLETGATAGTFSARPTGRAGVYHAVVRFPGPGMWSYEVYDGFTQYGGAKTHTFKPVEIDAVGSASSFPTLPVGGIALGLFFVGVAILLLRRPRGAQEPAADGR